MYIIRKSQVQFDLVPRPNSFQFQNHAAAAAAAASSLAHVRNLPYRSRLGFSFQRINPPSFVCTQFRNIYINYHLVSS